MNCTFSTSIYRVRTQRSPHYWQSGLRVKSFFACPLKTMIIKGLPYLQFTERSNPFEACRLNHIYTKYNPNYETMDSVFQRFDFPYPPSSPIRSSNLTRYQIIEYKERAYFLERPSNGIVSLISQYYMNPRDLSRTRDYLSSQLRRSKSKPVSKASP